MEFVNEFPEKLLKKFLKESLKKHHGWQVRILEEIPGKYFKKVFENIMVSSAHNLQFSSEVSVQFLKISLQISERTLGVTLLKQSSNN